MEPSKNTTVLNDTAPTPEGLRSRFEAIASDPSFKFRRSRKGTYVNPALARDWKWFRLGAADVLQTSKGAL